MASVPTVIAPDTRSPRVSLAASLRELHLDVVQCFRRVFAVPSKSGGDRFLSDVTEGKRAMRDVEHMLAFSIACADDVDAYRWVDGLRAEIDARRAQRLDETPLAELHDAQDRAEAEFDMAQRRAVARPHCLLAQERLTECGRVLEYRTKAVVRAEGANRARGRAPVGTTPLSSLMRRKDNTRTAADASLRDAARRRFDLEPKVPA